MFVNATEAGGEDIVIKVSIVSGLWDRHVDFSQIHRYILICRMKNFYFNHYIQLFQAC